MWWRGGPLCLKESLKRGQEETVGLTGRTTKEKFPEPKDTCFQNDGLTE